MSNFLKIPHNAKVNINWKVKQYDYSLEQRNNIISQVSEKYGIPKRHIKVTPIIINNNNEEITITNEVISNIQKPDFQAKLFKSYIKENKIENVDFNIIMDIDNEINNKIDYKVYDNFCRYSINWIKWSNFLSYGSDNYFDFRDLKKLVLLTGKPGNTSGKTTFAIELLHFLLFGKTNKSKTLANIFNNKFKEATEMSVEGSLTIEGEEYIIRRILSRPDAKKRTTKSKVTQKVSYFRVIGDTTEELEDVDVLMGENNIKTNQAIKKVIGDENDFDLIICATSKNLNELVSKTEGERGKLFTKWIGLLPIQEKNDIAKKHYNELKSSFKCLMYNREDLLLRINTNKLNISTIKTFIENLEKENKKIQDELKNLQDIITTLSERKNKIDNTLLQLDINTLNQTKKNYLAEVDKINENIKKGKDFITTLNYEEGRYSTDLNELFNKLSSNKEKLVEKKGELLARYNLVKENLDNFKKQNGVCPTCKRPYSQEEIDSFVGNQDELMKAIIKDGKEINSQIESISKEINDIITYRDIQSKYFQASIKLSTYEKKIEEYNIKLKEIDDTYIAYEKNKQAINENNEITIKINNYSCQLSNKNNTINQNNYTIGQRQNEIKNLENEITTNENIIKEIEREERLVYHWNIYLDMVGKNGISKMVLRKTLPIINANLATLLNEVCDFTLEIEMNEKNEVVFSMNRDGVKSDLSTCGSGYEETVASLALRAVLAKISTLPRLNFLLLDEIWGAVAKENLPKVQNMMNKLLDDYDFILQITHLDEVKDWHDTTITVLKENGISKIVMDKK